MGLCMTGKWNIYCEKSGRSSRYKGLIILQFNSMNMKEKEIRRYANRKMYDVEKSCYVSLADLAEIIRQGDSIRVTDKTGEKDFTAQILRQIILEQSKKADETPVSALHDWIRSGSTILDQQWADWKNGMESWLKGHYSNIFKGNMREDFDALKQKVNELEKKIEQL